MQIQKINNQQNPNFGAIRLTPPLKRHREVTMKYLKFRKANRKVDLVTVPEKIDATSFEFVDYLKTRFGSKQEKELLAQLQKYDSDIIAVRAKDIKRSKLVKVI